MVDLDTISQDRLTAAHEAGHTVAAHHFGALVYWAALTPTADGVGCGHVQHTHLESPWHDLVCTWAGCAATSVVFETCDIRNSVGGDYPAAETLVAKMLPKGSEVDRARLHRKALRAGERIVRQYRGEVDAIVRLLLRDNIVKWKALGRIFSRTRPCGRGNCLEPAPRKRKKQNK